MRIKCPVCGCGMTVTIYCNACSREVINITDIKDDGDIEYDYYVDSPEWDFWRPVEVIVECPNCGAEVVDIDESFDSLEACVEGVVEILRQKYGLTSETCDDSEEEEEEQD